MSGKTVEATSRVSIWDIIPPLIGLAGIGIIIQVSRFIDSGVLVVFSITQFPAINEALSRQVYILPISVLALAIMFAYDPENFRKFFRVGDLFASTQPLRILMISDDDSWKRVGPAIAGLVTIGTGVFMAFSVIKAGGEITPAVVRLFPFVLLFSGSNAWNEEIFTRFAPVAGLAGKIAPNRVYWISAMIFGVPHFFGTPGGFLGIFMAGFMGWLLAKSVGETRGIFWAWAIHFIQDIVIFSGMLMIIST